MMVVAVLTTTQNSRVAPLLGGALGKAVNVIGTLIVFFVAGYTGELFSVSN